jgi:hypothetical protein
MPKKPINPQLKTAIFIAPFLLIGGYVAMDYFTKKDPPDNALYQLHPVNERCDFSNNSCRFSNNDVQLSVILEERLDNGSNTIRVTSEQALKGVAIAIADIDDEASPVSMVAADDKQHWHISIQIPPTIFPYLRLVVSTHKGLYFAEAPVTM